MNFDLNFLLSLLPGLVVGLTIHEASHALSAKWLGDRTAEKMGRISLNPLDHFSPTGFLAFFLLGFGWGKPVIVNLYNFKKPRFHYLLTSLAGPASNLLVACISLALLYLHPTGMLRNALKSIFLINCLLATFNLLPIPPLDGSKIWPCLIPGMKPAFSGKTNLIWVGVVIIGLYSGAVDRIITPVLTFVHSLIPALPG
ncbi:Zn-dependent protease [Anaerohalosphaera lusitana]|uniref:Zn-dependent protease n=1 Tax=Anaerohalosphaera lusitana TaxID=1936003 RepID=A0A1U9NHB2_9BACT|nr:site-2 protease family protein [Anaerohalosphaera lusitana]AQT67322.1 Zn-dependent protease [Anaerohalosphaera lusitana]